MKTYKTFQAIVNKAAKHQGDCEEFSVENVELNIDDRILKPYTVSIAERDLLFYCEGGTATYMVDSYGADNTAELLDWEFEDENI